MAANTRRVIGDVLASASGLFILLVALVMLDQPLRDHLSSSGLDGAAGVGQHMTSVALVSTLAVSQFVRQQAADNAHMAVFTGAALVLAIFLMRL